MAQPDKVQRFVDSSPDLIAAYAQVLRPEGEIFLHGHADDLGFGILKRDSHEGPVGIEGREQFTKTARCRLSSANADRSREDAARGMWDEPNECHAKGRLAGPSGTGKSNDLAVVDGERDPIERRLGRVAIAKPYVA